MRFVFITLIISLQFTGLFALGDELREEIEEHHFAYVPDGDGRFRTVIIAPGCSGIASEDQDWEKSNPELRQGDLLFRSHYRKVAEAYKSEGYATFLIDVHSAEGVLTACTGEISAERVAEYIDGAIGWAIDHPKVQADSIHLVGYSMGGRGVLAWLKGPRSQSEAVSSAVAVYPGCAEHTEMTIDVPVLALLGGADDIADPDVCEEVFEDVSISDQISVLRYPGARHGFDIAGAPAVVDEGNGKTIGYQQEAAEASWQAILEFLSASD
jgi:dienelactone hydrolase